MLAKRSKLIHNVHFRLTYGLITYIVLSVSDATFPNLSPTIRRLWKPSVETAQPLTGGAQIVATAVNMLMHYQAGATKQVGVPRMGTSGVPDLADLAFAPPTEAFHPIAPGGESVESDNTETNDATATAHQWFATYLDQVEDSHDAAPTLSIPAMAALDAALAAEQQAAPQASQRHQPSEALSEQQQRSGVRAAVVELYRLSNPSSLVPPPLDQEPRMDWSELSGWLADPNKWEQQMYDEQWDPNRFVSGWRRLHWHGHDEFYKTIRQLRLSTTEMRVRMRTELRVLLNGFAPVFRPVECGHAEGKPRLRHRLNIVDSVLKTARNTARERAEFMARSEPSPVRTRPSASASRHFPEYAKSCVAVLESQGAVGEFTPAMASELGPAVVTELSVALNSTADGLRLCVPAMFVNAFASHVPFSMGTLGDATAQFDCTTDLGSVRDVKAGFLQSLLHRSCWRFACFRDPRDRSRILHFKHSHFGFSWAPLAFWRCEELDIDCYRALGLRWVQWVDDSVRRHQSLARNIMVETLLCTMYKCMGIHMAEKGHILGRPLVRYGGMNLHLSLRLTDVPEEKLARAAAQAIRLSKSRRLAPRQVASLAGRILSFSQGLRLARSLTRLLYHIVMEANDWDTDVANSPPFAALFAYLGAHLTSLNRRTWDAPPVALEAHVDASESGIGLWFAAVGDSRTWQCVLEYDANLQQLVDSGVAHSSGRESFGYYIATQFIHATAELRELAAGGTVLLRNDNQSSVRAAEHLGARDQFLYLYSLWAHLEAEQMGFTLQLEWLRRSLGGMPLADALSKPEDRGDIGFNHAFMRTVVLPHFGVILVADLMASARTTQCTIYWSRYLELGAMGVNFLTASLDRLPPTTRGRVAWLYAPFFLLERALKRVRMQRISCLVLHPVVSRSSASRPAAWREALRLLPVVSRMRIPVPKDSSILIRGRGIPIDMDIYPKSEAYMISYVLF